MDDEAECYKLWRVKKTVMQVHQMMWFIYVPADIS